MPQSHQHCLNYLTTNSLPPLVMTRSTHPPTCLLFSSFNCNLAQSAIALGEVLVWLEKKLTWRFWHVCCCFQMFVLLNNLMTTTVLPYSAIPAFKSPWPVMTVKHCLLSIINLICTLAMLVPSRPKFAGPFYFDQNCKVEMIGILTDFLGAINLLVRDPMGLLFIDKKIKNNNFRY